MKFEIRKVALPTFDFETTHASLVEIFGQQASFVQDHLYAEYDAGLGLALIADQDNIAPGMFGLMVKVEAIDEALAVLEAAGAAVTTPPTAGAHESRAVVELPGSPCPLILYGPR